GGPLAFLSPRWHAVPVRACRRCPAAALRGCPGSGSQTPPRSRPLRLAYLPPADPPGPSVDASPYRPGPPVHMRVIRASRRRGRRGAFPPRSGVTPGSVRGVAHGPCFLSTHKGGDSGRSEEHTSEL